MYFFQYDLDLVKCTCQLQLQFTSNAHQPQILYNAQVSKYSTYTHTCKIGTHS